MLKDRIDLYSQLEQERNSKLLVYVTSDRKGLETQIYQDILPLFTDHLDEIGDVEKITLYLYTRGGSTLAAWSLVNLIRNFCNNFEVIIPFHCHSAGTLISLGSNNIVMTKQATLGPIDPSITGPLNPVMPGAPNGVKVPVSVEFVNGYLEIAKKELKIKDQKGLAEILNVLSNKIHPLTLGQVFRAKSQIQMLAKKLLRNHHLVKGSDDKVINFLCSESGSHDYTIHRKEAREELGLNIEKPTNALYDIIKKIQKDIQNELELLNPFEPKILLGNSNNINYSFRRVIIESISGGCDVFKSEGVLQKVVNPTNPLKNFAIQDQRNFEGWKHETI